MNDSLAGLSRRAVLGGLVASAATGPSFGEVLLRAPRPAPLDLPEGNILIDARPAAPAADLIRAAQLGGNTGFAVADARTGLFLEGRQQNQAMPPASVAKAVTALYALEALGRDARFATRLIATGPINGGRLEGDLILSGTGDPTLLTDNLAQMAATLASRGVREVSGRFLVHDSALPYVREIAPDQPDHVGYNPSVSGLNLNFNRVHFEWKRAQGGYQLGMDARSDRLRPAVTMAEIRLADRSSPVYSYADRNGVDSWTVARGALGNAGSRWLPVRKPALYTGEVFQVLARTHGIQLGRPEPYAHALSGTVIVEHLSDTLGTVMTDMLKWSTNITAEAIGMTASTQLGAAPRSLPASGRHMSSWLANKIGVGGARFVDHSGLGDESRISADHMVRTLVQAGTNGPLRQMMKRIQMKDANGRRIQNHPARVVAKTGTLNFVSGLAGYVQTPSNAVLAFAIFSADLNRRRGLRSDQAERPEGGRAWTRRARALQQRLIERWVSVYGS